VSGVPALAIALVAVMSVALGAASCARQDAPVHDCPHAVEIVRRGRPAAADEWAWARVFACGDAGRAAARDAWLALRSQSDASRMAEVHARLWNLRDSALFEAARGMLLDGSATDESRVYSAMLLLNQLYDHADPEYDAFSSTRAGDVCESAWVTDRSIVTGTPLPRNAGERARDAARHVLSASSPERVRNAARCLDEIVQRTERVRARTAPGRP
jgi:hypothetical protein